jgi:hypothetical protein
MLWVFVGVLAIMLGYGCKGTPAPPLTADGLIDSTKVCTAPGVEYDERHGQVAVVAVDHDSVRGEIVPEKRSHRIKPDDLRDEGRVIARVRLLGAGEYTRFGLQDTTSACWYVKGDYPDNLVSTIYGFDGRVLKAGIQTRAKHDWSIGHLFHAHAHWEPVNRQPASIDLGPAELRADTPDSARRREAYARALQGVIAAGQGSCKTGGCCYPK